MPEDLQQKFSLKTNYSQSCSYDPNHDSFRTFRLIMFPVSADDVLDEHLLPDSNEFDVIQVIKHKLTLTNFIPTSKCSVLIQNDPSNAIDSDCAIISDPKTCGQCYNNQQLYSTNLIHFLLGTQEILQKGTLQTWTKKAQ